MEKLIAAIQDWPVLVQGAIGSALFWLVLLIGQRITRYLSGRAQAHSKDKQKARLLNEIIRFDALRTGMDIVEGARFASVLWYRASRHLISGLIWMTLGLLLGSVFEVFGLVGFIGCLYYLFGALDIVKPLSYDGDLDQKLEELRKQLAELEHGT